MQKMLLPQKVKAEQKKDRPHYSKNTTTHKLKQSKGYKKKF